METKKFWIHDDNATINDFLSGLSEDVTQEKNESFAKAWSVLCTYCFEGLKSEKIEGSQKELADAMNEVLFAHHKLCQILEAKKKGLID